TLELAVDLEPPIDHVRALLDGKPRAAARWLARGVSVRSGRADGERTARAAIRRLVDDACARGIPPIAAVLPVAVVTGWPAQLAEDVAFARRAGGDDLPLFDIGGALARPPAERWLEAFVATDAAPSLPETTLRARAAIGLAAAIGRIARGAGQAARAAD